MKKIGEHIARTISNAGKIIKSLNPENLGFEPLIEPTDPDAMETAVAIEKWKTLHKK